MSNKDRVRTQFGTAAALQGYATSQVHAQGESLTILSQLIDPQPTWQALDVATGAGHTAHRFAPGVARMIATDLTPGMVEKAAQLAADLGLTNVETRLADAEDLPFDDASFDLVTCRIAFHHFPNPKQAVAEFARVLKPGGLLGFTDNVTVADPAAAAYYNAYEALRDPSHHRVPPLAELVAMFETAGLTVMVIQRLSKELEFQQWADRMRVSTADKEKLLDMMRHCPPALLPLFAPRWADETMFFSLHEVVIVACRD